MTNELEIESVELDVGGIRELTLKLLQKSKVPIELKQLVSNIKSKVIGTNTEAVKSAIKSLVIEGYDIKEIIHGKKKLFALVRYPDREEKDMFRTHGQIKTPLLLTSDWHLGSKGFYKIAYNKLRRDIEEYSIESMTIAGDLVQGRGIYSTELNELLMVSLGDQISYAVDLLNEIDTNIHLISGNHEEKIQGSVSIGLDPLKLVAAGCDHVNYYGHVANLDLNKKYKYTMMHGAGAVTLASTQMIEKVWRSMVNKPNILHMGHNHQIDYVRKGQNKIGLNSGTLQRTNAWLLQKGFNAKIGWLIVEDMDDETLTLIDRHPKLN